MLKRFASWTLAGAAAVLMCAVAINAFDEAVHPEVQSYLAAPPRAIPEERNGYLQLVGLAVPGADPRGAARAYLAALEAAQAQRLAGGQVKWPELGDGELMPQYQAAGDFCALEYGPCIEKVRADAAGARRLLSEHSLLLERYRALLEFPEFLETFRIRHDEAPLPGYLPAMLGQRLFHIQAALRLGEGKAIQVAYDLERSVRLSRRMLAGASTMLGKMAAAAHARRAALFISEMLPRVARVDRKALARLAEALAPLSAEERSLAPAFAGELAAFASATRACGESEGALACYFFQPNATLNRRYFAFHKPFLDKAGAPAQRFDEMRAGFAGAPLPWWSLLYNPLGKVRATAGAGAPPWDYVARLNDVDALFRLVALQALIGERELSGERVPAFLAERAERYADPYTGKPMGWDAARRQLFFDARATRKRISAGLI